MINALNSFINLLTDRTFEITLLSNLIVGIIAALIIPAYLDWRKVHHSEVYLCDAITRKKELHMHSVDESTCEGTLILSIKNNSPFSLRDIYINIFLPTILTPSIEHNQDIPNETVSLKEIERGHRLFYRMAGPVYPGRYHNFSFEIKIKGAKKELATTEPIVYYYISTEVGIFPKTAGFINDENAQLTLENMRDRTAKLHITLPEKVS